MCWVIYVIGLYFEKFRYLPLKQYSVILGVSILFIGFTVAVYRALPEINRYYIITCSILYSIWAMHSYSLIFSEDFQTIFFYFPIILLISIGINYMYGKSKRNYSYSIFKSLLISLAIGIGFFILTIMMLFTPVISI